MRHLRMRSLGPNPSPEGGGHVRVIRRCAALHVALEGRLLQQPAAGRGVRRCVCVRWGVGAAAAAGGGGRAFWVSGKLSQWPTGVKSYSG